uniref:Uncharacterized protein n=2 Tax=Oryza TaxID=4527 RepID=A0A0D3EZF5_9ORYZ
MVHTASLLMRATWICQSPCTKLLKAAGHVYIIVVVIVNCESLSLYISPLMTMFELPCLTTPATQFAFGSNKFLNFDIKITKIAAMTS